MSDLISPELAPDDWFHTWVDKIEPTLTSPTIVYDYPHWQAALAKERGECAERFEVYLGGIELGNAFAEETDRTVIEARMNAANQSRANRGVPPHPIDSNFLDAVNRLPRCAGIAVGLDRLVMTLTGASSIRDVQVGP